MYNGAPEYFLKAAVDLFKEQKTGDLNTANNTE